MKKKEQHFNCPVEATLSLIGGKYKPIILWHLRSQALHYMDLQRLIPKASPKMLSQQLHALEDCGMVHREVIPEKPPKTIYSLTAFGHSIIPVINAMCDWGTEYMEGRDLCTGTKLKHTRPEDQKQKSISPS
ncbi:MAG: helix-turn-helix transcriptional regulator [Lachnospiraceae bacterium]|nr:helix-turn-helix transcriptional regulator [Lachnospiraceae bacterium]MCI9358660.1 helix-turn-helix transcriptional regulator [Lachnospiraceae bacterium]